MTKKSYARLERDRLAGKGGRATGAHANHIRLATAKAAAQNVLAKNLAAFNKEQPVKSYRWDELNDLHNGLVSMIREEAGGMASMYAIPELIASMDNAMEIAGRLKALDEDVNTFWTALEAIKALHADKTGDTVDADENAACIKIFEQYVNFEASYRGTVFPNIVFLSKAAGDAVDVFRAKRAEEERQAGLLNPDVVSDVGFKITPVAGITDFQPVEQVQEPVQEPVQEAPAEAVAEPVAEAVAEAIPATTETV